MILDLFTLFLYGYGLLFAVGAYHLLLTTTWRDLGRLYGLYRLIRRDGRSPPVALVGAVLTLALVGIHEDVIDSISEAGEKVAEEIRESTTSSERDWPPVTPIEMQNRYLPTAYSFERSSRTWPPFEGHRVELGGDAS